MQGPALVNAADGMPLGACSGEGGEVLVVCLAVECYYDALTPTLVRVISSHFHSRPPYALTLSPWLAPLLPTAALLFTSAARARDRIRLARLIPLVPTAALLLGMEGYVPQLRHMQ